jgi:hypothetical protein
LDLDLDCHQRARGARCLLLLHRDGAAPRPTAICSRKRSDSSRRAPRAEPGPRATRQPPREAAAPTCADH